MTAVAAAPPTPLLTAPIRHHSFHLSGERAGKMLCHQNTNGRGMGSEAAFSSGKFLYAHTQFIPSSTLSTLCVCRPLEFVTSRHLQEQEEKHSFVTKRRSEKEKAGLQMDPQLEASRCKTQNAIPVLAK